MDDIFAYVNSEMKMNRKIFVVYEGEVTEPEFLDALNKYVKKHRIPVAFEKVDNIHCIGSETDIGKVEEKFIDYLKDKYYYLPKDIKKHNDLFVYFMDFDRLRPSHDPTGASSHCEKLKKLMSFSKIPVKPILSDPCFEYWLYLLTVCQYRPRSLVLSTDYRKEIIDIVPARIRPTQGDKSYSDEFYRYVLNRKNIHQTIALSVQLRKEVKQLTLIKSISDIKISEAVLDKLLTNDIPYTMVDMILQEIVK